MGWKFLLYSNCQSLHLAFQHWLTISQPVQHAYAVVCRYGCHFWKGRLLSQSRSPSRGSLGCVMAGTTFEFSGTVSGLARLDTRDGYGVGWVASRCGTTTSSSPSHAPRHCILPSCIWRLILLLREWRPDLRVSMVGSGPTRLSLVRGLDPASTVLRDHYNEIVARYLFHLAQRQRRGSETAPQPGSERLGYRPLHVCPISPFGL